VQVIDGLAAIAAGVDDCPVAACQTLLSRDFSSDQVQMPYQRGVPLCHLQQGRDMFVWYDEYMHWGLGSDVRERVALLI